LADGLLIAAVHVDRDRSDRGAAVAELVEERLQRGGIATRAGPHDRARSVVADLGQVALAAAVGDLVDADHHQPRQALGVQALSDDPGDDRPDGVPADSQQDRDRRLGHLLGTEGDQVLEVARVARPRPGPRHGLDAHPAVRAANAAQLVLDSAALAGEVEVAPTPKRAVVDALADLPAARAHRPAATQRNPDGDSARAEEHIDDAGALKRQQAVECGRDPHGFLPRSLSFEHPAACRNDGRAGRSTPAQEINGITKGEIPAPAQASGRKRSTQTTGDPHFHQPARARAAGKKLAATMLPWTRFRDFGDPVLRDVGRPPESGSANRILLGGATAVAQ